MENDSKQKLGKKTPSVDARKQRRDIGNAVSAFHSLNYFPQDALNLFNSIHYITTKDNVLVLILQRNVAQKLDRFHVDDGVLDS